MCIRDRPEGALLLHGGEVVFETLASGRDAERQRRATLVLEAHCAHVRDRVAHVVEVRRRRGHLSAEDLPFGVVHPQWLARVVRCCAEGNRNDSPLL